MKKEFKLKKVLEHRNIVLEQQKSRLATLLNAEKALIEAVISINNLIHKKRSEMALESDFFLVNMYYKYLDHLELERKQAQYKLMEHKRYIAMQKKIVHEAYKNKSILEKMADAHRLAYNNYIDHMEAKAIEDIVTTKKASEVLVD